MKNNITFYTQDADDHNSWQMKTLRRKYNWEGVGRYYTLKGLIAQSPHCSMDITSTNKVKAIAAELDVSPKEFEQYLEYLQKDCELLTIDNGIITEAGILEDLKRVNKKRENDRDQKSLKGVSFSLENGSDTQQKQEFSLPKTQVSYPENEQIRLDKTRVEESKEENTVSTEKKISSEGEGAIAPPKQKKSNEEKVNELKAKQQDCLVRRENFKEELRMLKDEFPPDMINAFYKHWAELNKSKTKMKWEMQQTWELKLRLYKWEQNNQRFSNPQIFKPNGTNGHTPKQSSIPAGTVIEPNKKFGRL